ncbi:MAG TPA: SgcJ/EcaC family oxidoreductase [Glaciihabitans sp.]|jgi:uncharacterized protein (TIGR02246 family)|nr:SgcJ/EcaC family oxidoreductase [Glaciihabitans sp.]
MTLITETNDPTHAGIDRSAISGWVERYLLAWRTNNAADIADLFTEDAEYVEAPYTTRWIGRDAIVAGWRSRWDWQRGGWAFEWEIQSATDRTAVITGVGTYTQLGVFDNLWTITLDGTGHCTRFHMVNTERDS